MKKKNNIFKKLIPAAGMLLLSTAMLATSTYAWFSMNKTVTATGLEVTAKSNAKYLLINDVDTAGAGALTKVAVYQNEADNANKLTYPTAYYTAAGTLNGHATTANKWYTTTSNNPAVAVSGTDAIVEVTEGDSEYMLTYMAWLTLSPDSEPSTDKAIQVTYSLGANDDAATKAVVLIGANGANGKLTLDSTNDTATTAAAVNLSSSTTVPVTVYMYIDGNSTNVYSNYIIQNQITGNATLQFDLVDVSP